MSLRDEIEAAIEKIKTATYEPHIPVHHPRCPAVLPPYDAADCWGGGCG